MRPLAPTKHAANVTIDVQLFTCYCQCYKTKTHCKSIETLEKKEIKNCVSILKLKGVLKENYKQYYKKLHQTSTI